MENDDMGEPIKMYKDGETIETFSPSVASEWERQGWNRMPDMLINVAPVEPEPAPAVEPEHWAGDMLNYVEPEPAQTTRRKVGRPKKAQ